MAALSYLAARLGGALILRPQMVSPLWLGNVVLASMLLLVRRRIWPVLLAAGLAGFLVYDVQAGVPIRSVVWLMLSNAVEVLVAALCLSKAFGGMLPRLNSVRALAKYSFYAVFLAPFVGAFLGALSTSSNYWAAWKLAFFSEALGFLTLMPAILGWAREIRATSRKPRAYYLEGTILLVALVILGYLILAAPGKSNPPALLYSLVPLLLWSTLRFGSTGVSTSIIAIAFVSIWGVVHGQGPFTEPGAPINVLSLQLFLFFTAAPFTALAVLVEERKDAEQALRQREVELKEAQRLAKVGSWQWDPDIDAVTWSDELYRIAGLDPGLPAVTYAQHSKLYAPESWLRLRSAVEEALRTGTPYELDLEMNHADGRGRLVVVAKGEVGRDGTGRIVQLRGTVQDITARKQAQEELRESEERLRLAIQAGKMYACHWDAATDVFTHSPESAQILGADHASPITHRQVLDSVHPEDREKFTAAASELCPEKPDIKISYRMVRPDGTVISLERNSRAHFDENGKLLRIIGIVADITEHKRTEEALRESEERLRLAVHAGRMYAFEWVTLTDAIVRSGECANILNWMDDPTRDRGRQFVARVHPDDRGAYDAATDSALTPENPTYQTNYRMLRPDGSVIWLEENGRAFFDGQGRMLRTIGMVADVTERKLAEEAVSSLSRRLIEAQEQERARIARELHDDLSQRMALLQINLEQFEQDTTGLSSQVRQQLHNFAEVAAEVSADIHDLSHRLHPSKLDTLGLVASLAGLCREFCEQHHLQVQFVHHDTPGQIPKDVTLCLFRIVQEALQNVVKHSGASEATVELSGHSDRIDLCISDSGVGFNPESAKGDASLGLISMRERLRLAGGHLAVESEPSHGTRIHVRVPFFTTNDGVTNDGKAHKAGA